MANLLASSDPRQFVELYFYGSSARVSFTESPIRVQQTQSTFLPLAQRNAFRRRECASTIRSFEFEELDEMEK
jgi:hypothetical protein